MLEKERIMAHSFAQEAELAHSACGQTFIADVWPIMDAAEHIPSGD